jgi:hypothetical protein
VPHTDGRDTVSRAERVLACSVDFGKPRRSCSIPVLIVEVLSPDDRTRDTLRRFRDYEKFGVRHIVQMGPEDRITYLL